MPLHFGHFFADLRTRRGLTQGDVSQRSGISIPTIGRGEQRPDCEWRPSTSLRLMQVLEAAAPFTESQRTTFVQAAGLTALADAGRRVVERLASPVGVAEARAELHLRALARRWTDVIAETAGVDATLRTLDSIASLAGIQLPLALTNDADGHLTFRRDETIDGAVYRVYTPFDPKTGQPLPDPAATPPPRPGPRLTTSKPTMRTKP
jgi:hypothetical protein